MVEAVALEQFTNILPTGGKEWMQWHCPADFAEVVSLMEDYLTVKRPEQQNPKPGSLGARGQTTDQGQHGFDMGRALEQTWTASNHQLMVGSKPLLCPPLVDPGYCDPTHGWECTKADLMRVAKRGTSDVFALLWTAAMARHGWWATGPGKGAWPNFWSPYR